MKVVLKNDVGQYVAMMCGELVFSYERRYAIVYDEVADHVADQLKQMKEKMGKVWTAVPAEPTAPAPADFTEL